jgi:hypothetical protein
MRGSFPTTDALFAQEVEQKVSNLLAGLPLKHCTEVQLEAAESTPSHQSSYPTCLGDRIRTLM